MKIGKALKNIGKDLYDIATSDEVTKAAKKVGKAGFNTANGIMGAAGDIGKASLVMAQKGAKGAAIGAAGAINEAETLGRAAIGAVKKTDDFLLKTKLMKKTGLDESLIGRKATKAGVGLAFGGAVLAGSMDVLNPASKNHFLANRQGQHDGQITTIGTDFNTPYGVSQQMAYGSSIGQSFANNAGADGDLALALSKFKGGGMI